MKKILGLDLGTNSIGWSLIENNFDSKEGKIIGAGSRIIPMDQGILGDFDKGNSISQTAERTGYRGTRRIRQRFLLRRERLHRVLNLIGFLPEHYSALIDFENKKGQFIDETEVKIPYNNNNKFIFTESFNEMLNDFSVHQPELVSNGKKIPLDWTIYYLRKKALSEKISKQELAWIILNFNQKRGYYQLRGEDETETEGKKIEYHQLTITEAIDTREKNKKGQLLYKIKLENGLEFIKPTNTPLDWQGKIKEFIITTDINEDGSNKLDKEGNPKISFRVPKEDDWTLVKKKTEHDITTSTKTVGSYIYDTILTNPSQKIRGKLVRTIERKFYKQELIAILDKQKLFHKEFQDSNLYSACLKELYKFNDSHISNVSNKDLAWFIVNDIIFYQRPLKSKKSLIGGCQYESRTFINNDIWVNEKVKCIAKSHPLFQEFRLWQFISNIKIYERIRMVNGKECTDVDVTNQFIPTDNETITIYESLNDRKEIDQKGFLRLFKLNQEKYRWNYVEDKKYPCNETRYNFINALKKVDGVDYNKFLTTENEEKLWHILYSIESKEDIIKALSTFALKNSLPNSFIEVFLKYPPFKKDYGSYSAKAIKKLLPLMRVGKYWNIENIHTQTKDRIDKIITGEYDDKIKNRVREKAITLNNIEQFKGLPLWLACYIVYDRHSEEKEITKWETPSNIQFIDQHSLRNPIVEQVINETLRVVKDIWEQYGNGQQNFFDEIHVELGREMKNPADKRKRMSEQNISNENTNSRIIKLLTELKNEGVKDVRPYSPSQQTILKIYEEGFYLNEDKIPDDIEKIRKSSTPTQSEIKRYKHWLEQGYTSPYTGQTIPLSKLFTTDYEIEHIIPQARYFDDSLSNKVICETEVNKDKGSKTAYEYLIKNSGKIVDLGHGKKVTLLTKDAYQEHVKQYFRKNKTKLNNLLSEDIPEGFINRQLNDSRYISKVVKGLLSNIVRENNELEPTSKHVITMPGSITSRLKNDWGLNDVWNSIVTPRFVRLNEITSTNNFGEWKNGGQYFQTSVPEELARGFNKKRIDHRHHALDAIVIACTTRDHVHYLNSINSERTNYALVDKLRKREEVNGKMVAKDFHKPWNSFTQDTRNALEKIVVSFKQNTRVINKTSNSYEKWATNKDGILKKTKVKQTKGDNWAIRKPMHKETVYGCVNLQLVKSVSLNVAIDNWKSIKNKPLRNKIKSLINSGFDIKKVKKYFKDNNNEHNGQTINKVDIYYYDDQNVASRSKIDESFTSKKIESVTDRNIQQILLNHLTKYNTTDKKGDVKEQPELAFCQDGLEEMNNSLTNRKPIYKVRTYEPVGKKFNVGLKGNRATKFVEAAKGTNLFFAIYNDEMGNRSYDTIPLNIVIERQKQGLSSVPETNEKGDKLIFHLSPNDLVYVPTEDEINNPNLVNFNNLSTEQVQSVYKMVSCTGNQCFFICNNIAAPIWNKIEFSALNKMEKTINDTMIKQTCWKLKVNKLGNIKGVQR